MVVIISLHSFASVYAGFSMDYNTVQLSQRNLCLNVDSIIRLSEKVVHFVCICVFGTGDQTQGCVPAKQALYYLNLQYEYIFPSINSPMRMLVIFSIFSHLIGRIFFFFASNGYI